MNVTASKAEFTEMVDAHIASHEERGESVGFDVWTSGDGELVWMGCHHCPWQSPAISRANWKEQP